ncbi:uncharacterized protein LOC117143781 [Drosophila mauritiana]|uniref:Uncharacterized protein LOC117143781 n=1 Tax=Drosophila mauritiana TaxID=7226 RepID=A0A6P8K6G6_DROMA|nr:uncharacterized protein LOC117143781 [Drosophila mauritiana]
MKRHYYGTADDQQEVESSPSPPPPPPFQSPLSSPESLQTPTEYPILYVDVVKNKLKQEVPPSATPPQPLAPEFRIICEDFPALPGSLPSALPSTSRSGQRSDNWTATLSDREQVNLAKYRDTVKSSDPCVNTSGNEVLRQPINAPEKRQNMELLPQVYGYLGNHFRLNLSMIFNKQFLFEGVRQRVINAAHKRAALANPKIHPPPGFEKCKIFARLITNSAGMPLGGVTFELGSPTSDTNGNMGAKSSGSTVQGAFGMLGLAKKLRSINRNPLLFGNNVVHNMDGTADSIFTRPIPEARLAPQEMNYKLPLNYMFNANMHLLEPKIEEMQDELLFFFFYTYTGDMMQMLAAAELAERGWRYHKLERVWLIRQADNPNYLYHGFREFGEYNYFNMWQWKILTRHFYLDPEILERTLSKEELYVTYGYHPQMSGI